jgi:hypothetical protein
MKTLELDIETKRVITLQRISDILCNALEGGSNYWYFIEKFVEPKKWEFVSEPKNDIGRHWAQDYPLNEGGALIIKNLEADKGEEDKLYKLDLEAIRKGLIKMAEITPEHFANFIMEDDDALTADVFLQCCIFEDVCYG